MTAWVGMVKLEVEMTAWVGIRTLGFIKNQLPLALVLDFSYQLPSAKKNRFG